LPPIASSARDFKVIDQSSARYGSAEHLKAFTRRARNGSE
jgi:hypothetical protein